GLDGVAVVHAVARDGLPTRVLLLSAFTDSGLVYQALQNGAAGYLPKEARREQIVDAVLACARGETVVPAELPAGLVSEIRLAVVPLIVAARSIPHPNPEPGAFYTSVGVVAAYGIATLLWVYLRPVSTRFILSATTLDVTAISVLVAFSGGAFSEARLTYFL